MSNTLDDVYAEARRCARNLLRAGLAEDANLLDRAMCGSTSGEILTNLAMERGVTLLVVTHSAEVAKAAHRVLRVREGRLEETLADTLSSDG